MRYGFVIDHRRCIGCHACTVACKEENRVPLGAFRTWVKYVEKGTFPNTRRYFSVLRCNHCDDAPCVTICPTVALYRRPDGIVDLDGARCIGCKSCMQACPYDALYIDPGTGTAAKCHYCAHRVERGLEPACVIVCPERAIVAGDLDDSASEVARLVASEPVQVRKPEKGTRPKVFYVGADAAGLAPQQQRPALTYLWAERPPAEVDLVRMVAAIEGGDPGAGGARATPVYDAPHTPRPWGAKVAAYLWSKSVSAGALMVAALAVLRGASAADPLVGVVAPALALVFLGVVAALLVMDLKRPDRFHYLVIKGNPRSWLVRGAWILLGYGAVGTGWLVAGLARNDGALHALAPIALLAAGAAAGYSAFLFRQAAGRDAWQSPVLLPHLIVAAAVAGGAGLLIARAVAGISPGPILRGGLAVALSSQGLLFVAELGGAHVNADVARAARLITRGHWRGSFWFGVVVGGLAVPLCLVLVGGGPAVVGAFLALAGLWLWEDLWVKAGQSLPLS